MCQSRFCALMIGVTTFVLLGCLERKEHITISPSGAVHYRITYGSDSEKDLYEGDAVPRIKDGWAAEQLVEKDENGKEKYTLVAQTAFAPGKALPSNFATRTDGDADLYTQFPTTIKIEKRKDGTYFHFHRTYLPRPWAAVHALQERLVDAPLNDLRDSDPKQWTPMQRDMVARALVKFEVEKMIHFAREAFIIATDDAPQDAWLAAVRYMRSVPEHMDYSHLIEMLAPRENEADEALVEEMLTAEIKGIGDFLNNELTIALKQHASLSGPQFQRFMAEYDRQKKQHEITEDLGDDRFEITVEMPGIIVASNAEDSSASTATWKIDGQMLRDKKVELMATSRLDR
jgi:hypothetical protein